MFFLVGTLSFFLLFYVHMCLPVHLCIICKPGAWKGQKRVLDPRSSKEQPVLLTSEPSLQPPKLLLHEEPKEENVELYLKYSKLRRKSKCLQCSFNFCLFHYWISKNRKDFVDTFNTPSNYKDIPTGAYLGPSFPWATFPCGLCN